ncbi:hypothetical protein FD755_008723, partial [Muntiacus reevesi]
YRGFWAVLMLLGVVAVVTASFLIICAAPFTSHLLYKAGGGAYIAAGTDHEGWDRLGSSVACVVAAKISHVATQNHLTNGQLTKWLL